MTRRVTTPFPTENFSIQNGDLPEVRQWLHDNRVSWNSGHSVLTDHPTASNIVVRGVNDMAMRDPRAFISARSHENLITLTFATITPLTVKQVLTLFLKKHRMYSKFVENLDCGDLDYLLEDTASVSCLINRAFAWDGTIQGHRHWSNLDRKWINMCRSLNLESLERT